MNNEALILHEQTVHTKTNFGFWLYVMTDCILFASLFATYAALRGNTADGPSGQTLFDLPYVLAETLVLLTSSFTCGLAILATNRQHKTQAISWFAVTMVLGLSFLALEVNEFAHLAQIGAGWQRSGFLSAYFTLVGTHGLHIVVGLVWMTIMLYQLLQRGFTAGVRRRLSLLSIFWHFLDVIWIFIFSIVYLLGVLPS